MKDKLTLFTVAVALFGASAFAQFSGVQRVGSTSGMAPGAHAATHENGGADELDVGGLSGELADEQPPKDHATNHTDGTDDIQSATNAQKGLATAAQITALEANTTHRTTNPRTITAVFDGGGSAISAGGKWRGRIPVTGTLSAWYIQTDQAGTVVFDVWLDTFATGSEPDNADSITGGHEPTSGGTWNASDTDISDWGSVAVTAGDAIIINVDSNATHTWASIQLIYTED